MLESKDHEQTGDEWSFGFDIRVSVSPHHGSRMSNPLHSPRLRAGRGMAHMNAKSRHVKNGHVKNGHVKSGHVKSGRSRARFVRSCE
jgi:hypothetical protein